MRASGEPQALPDALGIIPARYGSTRLPGKPLVPLLGKPLVQHVWERARLARRLSGLLVATDDERIASVVTGFGGLAVMTSPGHASGTDRLAEVARSRLADVDTLVDGLVRDPSFPMGTLAVPLGDPREAEDPNVVKVVCDASGRALYFSRARIPHPRHPESGGPGAAWRRHIGIYSYRREFLLEFASWPPTPLERVEGLEQLRALERGRAIRVFPARGRYLGVDTPEDVVAVQIALGEGA
jgi:3-deoxy-manno-octulosonate cytidylyltransferase (CMP-KDO synthetase)